MVGSITLFLIKIVQKKVLFLLISLVTIFAFLAKISPRGLLQNDIRRFENRR
jgi:hypothetical protein